MNYLRCCRKEHDMYLHAATVGTLLLMNYLTGWMRPSQYLLLKKKQLLSLLSNLAYLFCGNEIVSWAGYSSGF